MGQESKQNCVAVILASHGYFAREALNSLEMVIGKQENVGTVSVTMDLDFEAALQELKRARDGLDTSKGLLILTDILGGTPSNIAGNMALTEPDVLVYSGFNFPVLVDLFMNRGGDAKALGDQMETVFPDTFINVSRRLKGDGEDAGQLD